MEAAAAKEIDVLFLVGVDPLRDFPDAALARRALQNVRYKVVVDIDAEAMRIYADAMLPAAPYLEKDGHYTDWEGRSQRLRPVRNPQGLSRSEWQIFQELSEVMGRDMGFHSLDDLHEEMARVLHVAGGVQAAVDAGTPARSPSARSRGAPAGYPPPVAGDTLTLFTYPLLVDEGRLSVGAEALKEALEEPAFVEVNLHDAERLGLREGAEALLRTEAGEARLPVRVSEHIAAGAVFVPYNQPGFAANRILSGRLTTVVALEATGEGHEAGASDREAAGQVASR
jgi:NADH-quinone oxidoreductase subunit G